MTNSVSIDQAEIHKILLHIPHRYPFLLIDRVEGCEPGKWVRVIKNVSVSDWFFGNRRTKVMPQMLVIEALAQAAGVLCHYSGMMSEIGKSIIFFAGIEKCIFERDVVPGDQLTLECVMKRSLRGVAKLRAEARVGEQVVVTSTLTAVVRELATE